MKTLIVIAAGVLGLAALLILFSSAFVFPTHPRRAFQMVNTAIVLSVIGVALASTLTLL